MTARLDRAPPLPHPVLTALSALDDPAARPQETHHDPTRIPTACDVAGRVGARRPGARRPADAAAVRRRASRRPLDRGRAGRRVAAAARPRDRPVGGRAGDDLPAVQRGLRPDGGPPADPRGGAPQPDLLLRGQGSAARRRLRDGTGLRGPPEQEAPDEERGEGPRLLRADAARPAGEGADTGPDRPRDRPGRRPAGAAGDRGLLRSHPHERERGGRDRPRRPRDRLGRRPVREGRLRAQGQQRLGEPGRAQRGARRRGQASRGDPRGSRGTSRTTTSWRW